MQLRAQEAVETEDNAGKILIVRHFDSKTTIFLPGVDGLRNHELRAKLEGLPFRAHPRVKDRRSLEFGRAEVAEVNATCPLRSGLPKEPSAC